MDKPASSQQPTLHKSSSSSGIASPEGINQSNSCVKVDKEALKMLSLQLGTVVTLPFNKEKMDHPSGLIPLSLRASYDPFLITNYHDPANRQQYIIDSIAAWEEERTDPITALSHKVQTIEEFRGAVQYNLMALKRFPDNLCYRFNLAYIYHKNCAFEEAFEILRGLDAHIDRMWLHQKLLYYHFHASAFYERGEKGAYLYWDVLFEKMVEEYLLSEETASLNSEFIKWLVQVAIGDSFHHLSDYTYPPDRLRHFTERLQKRLSLFHPKYIHRPPNGGHKEKLRIGYISGDFCTHPVSTFILPIFKCHDHNAFEIYCYYNNSVSDEHTVAIKSLSDSWKVIHTLPEHKVAEMIYNDQVDILVDLSGITSRNNLETFLFKPAPIQASYLGFAGTTGIQEIDYKIVSTQTDSSEEQSYYTESLIRLPSGMHTYRSYAQEQDILRLHRTHGPIIFGSFAGLHKLHPQIVNRWISILKQVPDSQLMLKLHDLKAEELSHWLKHMFEIMGVSPSRLHIVTSISSPLDHLFLYNRVDICLDAWPYSGTTTSCDALSMGVPIVTYYGESHVSRVTSDFLHQLGCQELIAYNWEEYIEKAVSLALDRTRLKQYHETIPSLFFNSPLGQPQILTKELEDAYRYMWKKYTHTYSATQV
jgi:predicted O-linked N-acetylglucosamine transferase (SPINDLY family)